jgi:proteasome lid subunit RPN8/RPN11
VSLEVGAGWPLARLVTMAESSTAAEICGLLVGGEGGRVEPWPITNASATPASAFELAPGEVLLAMRWLDERGGRLLAVYHSHLAGGADLSARDLAGALVGGVPVLPGASLVVVALEGGRARSVRAHRWTGRRFEPVDLWWR